jgi:hypothetical protein
MEVSGQLHAWSLYSQGKSPWYPLDRRLGRPQAGLDAMVKRKIPSLSRILLKSTLEKYIVKL